MAFGLISFRVVLAALALVSVASCSDDKDATPAPTTGMSWTVDGSNVTATTSKASESSGLVTIQGGTGTTATSTAVTLTVPARMGTFSLADATINSLAVYGTSNNQAYFGETGTVVVTSYTESATAGSSEVVGTFTFTGAGTAGSGIKTLTNGKFNLKY